MSSQKINCCECSCECEFVSAKTNHIGISFSSSDFSSSDHYVCVNENCRVNILFVIKNRISCVIYER